MKPADRSTQVAVTIVKTAIPLFQAASGILSPTSCGVVLRNWTDRQIGEPVTMTSKYLDSAAGFDDLRLALLPRSAGKAGLEKLLERDPC